MEHKTINNFSAQEIQAILRQDFTAFIEKVFYTIDPVTDYLHNWHIDLIAEYLIACQRREIKKLIINIPPRHLKSLCVAVAFPAWLLGHNPGEQIMCASYSRDLSFQHSMNTRIVMESDWYQSIFTNTRLLTDQNTKRKFVTDKMGFRIATSVGSTATGEGGNFLIVDDPLSADQARSEVMRDNANRWFDQTFASRLNDKKNGVMIIIMQRLHENDLTAHLLKKGDWEHLCIPLIAEEHTIYKRGLVTKIREEGELLHPKRIDAPEVERLKSEAGTYAFVGQYQQKPSPIGGGEFRQEWIQYYSKIDYSKYNTYIFVDPANSKTKTNDFTAMIVVGAAEDGNLYILDMVRDKMNVREREDTLFDLHAKYKPQLVAYEKYGMQVDIDWIKKSMEDRNYRFRIEGVGGSLKKEDRIRRLIRYFYEEKIYLPRMLFKSNFKNEPVDIVHEFIHQEYNTFPVGLHDDMLDALSRIADVNIIYPGASNIDYYKIYNYSK